MQSIVSKAYKQAKETGRIKLFKSYSKEYGDGEQKRDFIYVKDLVAVLDFIMNNQPESGIYNLGTGKARSFYDLAKATFDAMGKTPNIEYVDIPEDIRGKYQYFTEAKMEKLRNAGYTEDFYTLEEGIKDYVQNYLLTNLYY